MSEKKTATQRLEELALEWANGKAVAEVLIDAYAKGYNDGQDDAE